LKRNGLIVLALAAAAWAVVAVLLGTGALSGSKQQSARAPHCLPRSVQHSAALAGTNVDVSPAPGTGTANPDTQISFLGVSAGDVRDVSAQGSLTGPHPGRLASYSQGDGASFIPDRPFAAGERVEVHATIASHRQVSFSFGVDTPYATDGVQEFSNPPASPSEYETFRTIPQMQAPILAVTTPDRDPGAGDVFTSNGPGPGMYGALIYTPQGRLVWFDQLPPGIAAEDVNVQEYEGAQALTFWQGRVLSLGYGNGEDVVMNDQYQTIAKVKAGNGLQSDLHEFQLAPDHVAWITAYNPIRCDLSSAEGGPKNGVILDGAVQEIDMRTGLVRWEWHALDHVATGESKYSPPKSSPWDWFHINSIDPQPGGDVFISARNTWAGYQIEGGSGRTRWQLGGEKSSFAMGPGTRTAWQHDGRVLPNGEVTFFDDGSNPPKHSQSRGVRIALDLKTRRARLTASYTHPSTLLAASQGNMQTLPDGNVLIGYGGVPQISELSSGGSLLFDAHLPFDLIFYRAYRHPWSGRPASPPAVFANLNNTSEETIVRASWNGATGVAAWRVLAGEEPHALKARITVPDDGFESAAILPQKHSYVAVQALGASGEVLGASPPSRVVSFASSLPGKG
jgi:hypothetical protein